MTPLAVTLAAVAAALSLPHLPHLPHLPRLRGHDPPRPRTAWLVLILAGATAGLVLRGHALAATAILAAAAFGFGWLAVRGRARKAADETRVRVIEACEAMASELRSGQPPVTAVERGAQLWQGITPVVAAIRLDADVPDAFRRVSRLPGAGVLGEVGAAWYVCQAVGSGLADALERVVDNARGQLAARRVVSSELASATATARMVAVLPVVLLVLSDGSGSDPWGFLFQSTAGLIVLSAGLALAFTGMWWIDRIVTGVDVGDQ